MLIIHLNKINAVKTIYKGGITGWLNKGSKNNL